MRGIFYDPKIRWSHRMLLIHCGGTCSLYECWNCFTTTAKLLNAFLDAAVALWFLRTLSNQSSGFCACADFSTSVSFVVWMKSMLCMLAEFVWFALGVCSLESVFLCCWGMAPWGHDCALLIWVWQPACCLDGLCSVDEYCRKPIKILSCGLNLLYVKFSLKEFELNGWTWTSIDYKKWAFYKTLPCIVIEIMNSITPDVFIYMDDLVYVFEYVCLQTLRCCLYSYIWEARGRFLTTGTRGEWCTQSCVCQLDLLYITPVYIHRPPAEMCIPAHREKSLSTHIHTKAAQQCMCWLEG